MRAPNASSTTSCYSIQREAPIPQQPSLTTFDWLSLVQNCARRVYPAYTTAAMGVPFEALIPYAIMLGMFSFTGAALSKIRHMQNGGKRARHSIDQWDRQMMDRDRRLTGFLRGQSDTVRAPAGFELSNPWRIEKNVC